MERAEQDLYSCELLGFDTLGTVRPGSAETASIMEPAGAAHAGFNFHVIRSSDRGGSRRLRARNWGSIFYRGSRSGGSFSLVFIPRAFCAAVLSVALIPTPLFPGSAPGQFPMRPFRSMFFNPTIASGSCRTPALRYLLRPLHRCGRPEGAPDGRGWRSRQRAARRSKRRTERSPVGRRRLSPPNQLGQGAAA